MLHKRTLLCISIIAAFSLLSSRDNVITLWRTSSARALTFYKQQANGQIVEEFAVKKHKRWAVMLIGGARTYAFCRESFLKNVVNVPNPPMDIYTYSFDTTHEFEAGTRCSFAETLSLTLLSADSKGFHLDREFQQLNKKPYASENMSDEQVKTHDRFVRQQPEHLRFIDDQAKQSNITYDYILFTRPDLVYASPLNLSGLEMELELNPNALFAPECCSFGGICDRFAIATYDTFSRMVETSEDWWKKSPKNKIYEEAFLERASFANISHFNMTEGSISFGTLRHADISDLCTGEGEGYVGTSWVDYICLVSNNASKYYKDIPDLIDPGRPGICTQVNHNRSC